MPSRSPSQRHRHASLGVYLVDVPGLPHRGTSREVFDFGFIPARSRGEAKRHFQRRYEDVFEHRPGEVRVHRLTQAEEERYDEILREQFAKAGVKFR